MLAHIYDSNILKLPCVKLKGAVISFWVNVLNSKKFRCLLRKACLGSWGSFFFVEPMFFLAIKLDLDVNRIFHMQRFHFCGDVLSCKKVCAILKHAWPLAWVRVTNRPGCTAVSFFENCAVLTFSVQIFLIPWLWSQRFSWIVFLGLTEIPVAKEFTRYSYFFFIC